MPVPSRRKTNDGAMSNGCTVSIESNQLPVLQAGHFLFTSESVGEGHPGTFQPCCSAWRHL